MKIKKVTSLALFLMLYSNILLFCAFPNPRALGSFLQEFAWFSDTENTNDSPKIDLELEEGNEAEKQTEKTKKSNLVEEEIQHELSSNDIVIPQNIGLSKSIAFISAQFGCKLGYTRLLLPPPKI